jgi:hypothetical protein
MKTPRAERGCLHPRCPSRYAICQLVASTAAADNAKFGCSDDRFDAGKKAFIMD